MLKNDFGQSVVNFAQTEENLSLFVEFKDFFNHYISQDKNWSKRTNINITSFDSSVSLDEKSKIMHKRFLQEVCKHAGMDYNNINNSAISLAQYSVSPMFRWATYAVINAMVDAVLPDVLKASDAALYTDFNFIGFGESASYDVEPRDLFVITKSGRNIRHTEAKKQFRGQVTVDPVEHDITVQVQLYRVLAGKENLAEFVAKAILAIENQMAIDAYTAFDTAFDALTSTYDDSLYINGFSEDGALALAERVESWNNAPAIFVGTKTALKNILPNDANYRYSLESDYVSMGYVRDYNGYSVLALPQRADWRTEFNLTLDNTKIYCISPSNGKLIKHVSQGDMITITDGTYANADLTQNATMKKAWGQALCTSAVYGCIDLS